MFSSCHICLALVFLENEVDGETVDRGLTESMIAYLFEKSFKKQLKFRDFVQQNKQVVLCLEEVQTSVVEPVVISTPAASREKRYGVTLQLLFKEQ